MAKSPEGFDLGITPKARGAWEELCRLQDENPIYPCSGNPDLYTDSDFLSEDEAEQICYGCPLLQACYKFAIANNEQHGVWGGINFSIGSNELF